MWSFKLLYLSSELMSILLSIRLTDYVLNICHLYWSLFFSFNSFGWPVWERPLEVLTRASWPQSFISHKYHFVYEFIWSNKCLSVTFWYWHAYPGRACRIYGWACRIPTKCCVIFDASLLRPIPPHNHTSQVVQSMIARPPKWLKHHSQQFGYVCKRLHGINRTGLLYGTRISDCR